MTGRAPAALSAATSEVAALTAERSTERPAGKTAEMDDAMAGNNQLKRVGQGDIEIAARTLAAAFATDPVFMWMADRTTVAPKQFVRAFSAQLRSELRHEHPEILMAPDGGCVTIWHGIDAWKASPADSLRVTPGFIRSFGVRHVRRLLRAQAALDAAHPSAPHYHLAFIGTDPTQQGRGLGSSTLAPMLERCDREGVPAYLESSNPVNDAFYVRQGFEVTGRIPLPDGSPQINAMWREPRS